MNTTELQIVALKTIVAKEIHRFVRIWKQTLIPPVINQSLYFLIFGSFIGAQLPSVQGVSYMAFIVPGLVMMSIIQNSFANVVSSFFGSKYQGSIEELLVSPTRKDIIVLGYTLGGMARGVAVGTIVWAVSLVFVPFEMQSITLVAAFTILTSMLFSLGGLTMAIFANSFDDISFVPTFILTPLTYLGGVFYSINALPDLWRFVSYANPIAYMIDGFRAGFYGTSELPLSLSLTVVTAFCIFFAVLNVFLLRRGVRLQS